ncbi:MAG TPA: hypothetical protein VLZ75_00575 [Chitinophagales bacterium]|nr:hypothetical protein [Chitinophagales bacterium]
MTFKSIFLGAVSTILFANMYAQDSAVVTSVDIEAENENLVLIDESAIADSLTISEDATKIRKPGKGWYFEVFAGWGMPYLATGRRSPLAEIGDKDWYQRGKRELSVKPLFGTNGGGWAGNFTIGHMFNKNVGIDATFTVAKHPDQLDARIDIVGYFADQYTGTNAVYFAPHIVFKWENEKRFGITGKAGLIAPIYGSTVSRAQIFDKSGRMLQTLLGLPIEALGGGLVDLTFKAKTITSYNPTLGISASVAFEYKLNQNIQLFANARVAAYTISLKETKFDELYMNTKLLGIEIEELGKLKTQIRSIDEAPEFLRKIVYRDELTLASNTGRFGGEVDLNKPMDELAQRFNASSMYFNIGMTYKIDRWEKRNAKKAKKNKSSKKK